MSAKYYTSIAFGVVLTMLYIAALAVDVYGIIDFNPPSGVSDVPSLWFGFRELRDDESKNRQKYDCETTEEIPSVCEDIRDSAATAFAFGMLGLVTIFLGTVMIGLKAGP